MSQRWALIRGGDLYEGGPLFIQMDLRAVQIKR